MENVTAAVPERPNNKGKKCLNSTFPQPIQEYFILLRPEVLPNVHFENILQVIQDILLLQSRDSLGHPRHPFGGRPNGRSLLLGFRFRVSRCR